MKSFSVFVFIFLSLTGQSQSFDTLCRQQELMISNLKLYHINPPEFDTKTNLDILDLFIKEADPKGMFFLKSDKELLSDLFKQNLFETGYCPVLKEATKIFQTRIQQVDSIISLIEIKPLSFSDKDTVTFIGKSNIRALSENLNSLKKRIENRIKYDCLNYIVKPTKEGEDVEKFTTQQLSAKESDSKKKSILKYRHYLSDFLSPSKSAHYLADAMSNAIANRCDPHSNYFNPFEKENFDAALSTEEFSFGFYASADEDGNITVYELIPGSAAWKSNELHQGDVILSFQFFGENKIDVQYLDIEEFYTLFYSSSSKKIDLTVRKKDNQIKTIHLEKTKIQSMENVMNSFILKDESSKYGYIPIPSFYSNNENDTRLGCANDVAKEIIKLKQEGINGLILDLRYNGGGSMQEAMGLAGIFIDEGPLAIFKSKVGKPFLLKDFNRGSIYDGPLIVLINGGSASASEFLTATLQDYNRALVVGSTSYGKGTAQNVFPIDSSLYLSSKKAKNNPSFGFAKITIGKFYRITAISHQAKGIEPDIHIPDIIEKIARKESDEDYFLVTDSVNKKVMYSPYNILPIDALREKSEKRISSNQLFIDIELFGDSLKKSIELDQKLVLNIKPFKKYLLEQEKLNNRIEALFHQQKTAVYEIENNSYTKELISIDEYQKKTNLSLIDQLKTDISLNETFLIMKDLLSLMKK